MNRSHWLASQIAHQGKRTLKRQHRRWPLIAAWVYVGLVVGVLAWVTVSHE